MIKIVDDILLLTGSFIIFVWGVAHIIPVKSVVKGFGEISRDNRLIITMEWIAEGLTLCFIGVLVFLVVSMAGTTESCSYIVGWASAIMLLCMAGVTLFTGVRTSIVPIKVCPAVKIAVALLFILALTIFS